MNHLTLEQIAELREDLLSMRNRLIKQAEEQIRDPSDVAFQGGDEIINLQRIRTRELRLLRNIDYALMKIENETYGIREVCGVFIPFERLKARPVTTMCINCKELEEEGENE